MQVIVDFFTFYFFEFYQSISSILPISMLYVPIHILLLSFFCNRFSLQDLKAVVNKLGKPVFCATLQSLALPWMFGLTIARELQGLKLFSIPVIVDEIQCLLIIVFTYIYSRITLEKRLSWLCGLLIFIFSIPMIGGALYMLSLYAIFPGIKSLVEGFFFLDASDIFFSIVSVIFLGSLTAILFLVLSTIQMISLRKIIRVIPMAKDSFFAALFCSNLIAMLIIKGILSFLKGYFNIIY